MVDITVLKVDLEGASFVANAPFSGRTESADDDGDDLTVEPGPEPPTGDRGRRTVGLFAALVGLVFLVAVAAIVGRRLRGDESEGDVADITDAADVEITGS